jgi:hypothetical protein
MSVQSIGGGVKPRITDEEKLREIVARLKRDGVPPEEIPLHVVTLAVVDLDDLNAMLKAA